MNKIKDVKKASKKLFYTGVLVFVLGGATLESSLPVYADQVLDYVDEEEDNSKIVPAGTYEEPVNPTPTPTEEPKSIEEKRKKSHTKQKTIDHTNVDPKKLDPNMVMPTGVKDETSKVDVTPTPTPVTPTPVTPTPVTPTPEELPKTGNNETGARKVVGAVIASIFTLISVAEALLANSDISKLEAAGLNYKEEKEKSYNFIKKLEEEKKLSRRK